MIHKKRGDPTRKHVTYVVQLSYWNTSYSFTLFAFKKNPAQTKKPTQIHNLSQSHKFCKIFLI